MRRIVESYAGESVFQPEDVAILIAAFDLCWEQFQKSGVQFDSDLEMQTAAEQLARSIIQAASQGERDTRRLCEDAILFMTKSDHGTARRVG
jgi:hypothetical protein